MYSLRLVVGNDGNLSARVGADRVLTTPAGSCKGFLQPNDLVLVDMQGHVVSGGRPSTELPMHLAAYSRRVDVEAVVHGHPAHATAFAAAGRALDACVLPEVVTTLGRIPVTDYGTPSTSEVPRVVTDVVGNHDAFLLRNHGAVAVGTSVFDALAKLETVEHLAQITLLANQLGGATVLSRAQVDRLVEIRGVYGLEGPVPDCSAADESTENDGLADDRLADVVAKAQRRARAD